MTAASATDLSAQLRLAINRINRKLRVTAAKGLTPSQSSTLACLAGKGPLSLGELARREGVTAPSESRIVDRLVDLGLVERQPDPEDARRLTIALTREGREAAMTGRDAATVLLATALERRSPDEIKALEAALPALQALVEDLQQS